MSKRIEEEVRKQTYIENVINMIMDGNSSDIEQLGEDGEEDEEEWTPQTMHDDGSSDSSDEEDYQDESELRSQQQHRTQSERSQKAQKTGETAEQTNLYSVQKEGKSVNTTAKEIEQVLGMYIHMGLVQMSSVRAYWEMETRLPAVCHVMSRDRFLKLLTVIHFQDNLSVSDDAKKDKLWKLRPWLQKLGEQFLCIPPEESHAVDEIMVPFKGKSHLRVYMPAKPHKWGFKMWGRAGQSGFLYDFDICQGAENPDREKSEVGVTGEAVLKMTSTLPAGKNHKVFADNYFTSVPLVQHLKERGIHYVGTIRMNRMKHWSMNFRVNQENNIVVRWYDNKAVNLISSFVGTEPVGNVKRWDRKSKTHIMVPRPAIVETYNKFMGGVDLLDMLSALYKFSFRSRRWYMYIWWNTVTVAVINAWNLYRRDQKKLNPKKKLVPLRRFQALVGTSLTSAGKAKIRCGRPLSSPEETPTPHRKRPSCSVPLDVRRGGIDHFPIWETRQRCKHCTERLSSTCVILCRVSKVSLVKKRSSADPDAERPQSGQVDVDFTETCNPQ
uniref:PiggyBac transposable element-derived protein domain-containing protein n=1 Tax=Labrus bergylta TaxID=56723 RepID=A0A3Q3E1X0_9LABR